MNMQKSRRGQGVVELAFALPIFLFIIIGIWDFGRVFHCYSSLSYMVNAATRKASEANYGVRRFMGGVPAEFRFNAITNTTLQEVMATFNNARSPLMDPNRLSFTQTGIGGSADRVTISATYQIDLLTPVFSTFFTNAEGQTGMVTLFAQATELKE